MPHSTVSVTKIKWSLARFIEILREAFLWQMLQAGYCTRRQAAVHHATRVIGERDLVVQTARFYDRVRRVSTHARLRYALLFIRNRFHMCYLRMRQDKTLQ